ncbi:hypothetical protein C0991_009786 [Blastosporella zonata]|nr:hypothetical protein C0991_009786 [Blastosporella zonata]
MTNIFGIPAEDIEVVTEDGAPSGIKDFLVWNPTYIDEKAPSLGRHSPISDATGLMRFLMKRGIRVILFCKIRKVCELAMKTIRADLSSEGRFDILERTMPYRGAQEEKYAVVNVTKAGGSILEEVEISRAMFEVYEGGVVKEVSHDSKIARVVRADVNWMTSPSNIDAVQTYRIKEVKHSSNLAYYGKVEVEVKVFGQFLVSPLEFIINIVILIWHRILQDQVEL